MAEIDDLHAAVTRMGRCAAAELRAVSDVLNATEIEVSLAAYHINRIAAGLEEETSILTGIPLADALDPPSKPLSIPPYIPDWWHGN